MWLSGRGWVMRLCEMIHAHLTDLHYVDWSDAHTLMVTRTAGWQLLGLVAAVVGTAWCLAVLSSVAQIGITFHTKPIEFDPNKLNPAQGWQRIWSMESGIRGLMSVGKLSCAIAISVVFLVVMRSQISLYSHGSARWALALLGQLITTLCLIYGGFAVMIGAIDYWIRWFRHEQKLRMSREEIKQEAKEDQGDQQIKQKMRKFQQQAKQQRSLRDVSSASVVVTNPTHFAVALKYDATTSAPVVVAKGVDGFAKRIIRKAKEANVPVREQRPLARALYALGVIGKPIPVEFYRAVAVLLAEIYRRKRAA